MPRGDGTGPAGMGPMTGHAAGFCAGYATPGFANPIPARGLGMGGGRGGGGRGYRNMFYATGQPGWMRFGGSAAPIASAPIQQPNPEMARQALARQAEILQSQLDAVKKRMAEFDGESAENK